MQPDDFANSPTGSVVPITVPDSRRGVVHEHFAFVPRDLPTALELQSRTYKLISEAERISTVSNSLRAGLPVHIVTAP